MAHRIVATLLLILLFLAVGFGIFKLFFSMRPEPARTGQEAPRAVVRVQEAVRGSHLERLAGYGQAAAVRRADVAAEVPGVVVWVSPRLEAGAEVRGPGLVDGVVPEGAEPGEILVRLDDRDLKRAHEDAVARQAQAMASRTRAEANLASIKRRLVVARRDHATSRDELRRVERLHETKTATASELDRQRLDTAIRERSVIDLEGQQAVADAEIVRADADLTAAAARERRAEQDVARTVIRAPYRGRIERRFVKYRSRVAPGTLLFGIVDPSRVEVAVAVGGSHFGEFAVGSRAAVRRTEGGPVIWRGRVARVSPMVDSSDRTCRAYLVIEGEGDEPAGVPPGEFVLAEIDGASHEGVIAVPRTAFLGEKLYVAVPEEGDGAVVEERTPRIRRWLADVALVESGIEPGERIIVTNLENLGNGSRVSLAEKAMAGGGAEPR